MNEAAVSPVMGAILMIGIAAGLIYTVSLIVVNLGHPEQPCWDMADEEWRKAGQAMREGREDDAYEHQRRAEFYQSLPADSCPSPEAA